MKKTEANDGYEGYVEKPNDYADGLAGALLIFVVTAGLVTLLLNI
jgi:hypothetical protein